MTNFVANKMKIKLINKSMLSIDFILISIYAENWYIFIFIISITNRFQKQTYNSKYYHICEKHMLNSLKKVRFHSCIMCKSRGIVLVVNVFNPFILVSIVYLSKSSTKFYSMMSSSDLHVGFCIDIYDEDLFLFWIFISFGCCMGDFLCLWLGWFVCFILVNFVRTFYHEMYTFLGLSWVL